MKITKQQLQEMISKAIDEEIMTEGPKMTRQHFQLIADVLRNNHAEASLVAAFADALNRTNPGFRRETFVAAAGIV